MVWPESVLLRLREFLAQRCKANEQWRNHETPSHDAFMQRYGEWRGPYKDSTFFFYLDEHIKDAPIGWTAA